MKTRILGIALLVCLAAAGTSWAISSEPVYIKNPEQLQALKGHLVALQKALKTNAGLFESQDKLESIIEAEIARLAAIKKVDPATKIDVTKVYRSLDTEGKALAMKNRPAGSAILEKIAESIDFVSTANNYMPRWKWMPLP
jgi:hypothetical protein